MAWTSVLVIEMSITLKKFSSMDVGLTEFAGILDVQWKKNRNKGESGVLAWATWKVNMFITKIRKTRNKQFGEEALEFTFGHRTCQISTRYPSRVISKVVGYYQSSFYGRTTD